MAHVGGGGLPLLFKYGGGRWQRAPSDQLLEICVCLKLYCYMCTLPVFIHCLNRKISIVGVCLMARYSKPDGPWSIRSCTMYQNQVLVCVWSLCPPQQPLNPSPTKHISPLTWQQHNSTFSLKGLKTITDPAAIYNASQLTSVNKIYFFIQVFNLPQAKVGQYIS